MITTAALYQPQLMLRTSLANIAAQARDQRIAIDHDVVISGNSTETHEAMLVVPAPGVTNIEFRLKQPSKVRLEVYNLLGQRVAEFANRKFDAGSHLLVAGLSHLAPGKYVYHLATDRITLTKSLVITR